MQMQEKNVKIYGGNLDMIPKEAKQLKVWCHFFVPTTQAPRNDHSST